MNTHVFQPNKRATLYDAKRDSQISGVLFFKKNSIKNTTYTSVNEDLDLLGTISESDNSLSQEKELVFHKSNQEVMIGDSTGRFNTISANLKTFSIGIIKKIKSILLFITDLYVDFCVQFFGLLQDSWKMFCSLFSHARSTSKKDSTVHNYGAMESNNAFSLSPFSLISRVSLVGEWIEKVLHVRQSSFATLRLPVALICLFLAFVSMGALLFPLISAQIFAGVPKTTEVVVSPTPLRYNTYYQESSDPLYPIREFRLSVPKINLESNIVDNVDPNIEGEYKDKLQFGVAHAKGSYLPPEKGGPVYLFAHSTDTIFNIARFNAKFYSVRELEAGDEIKLNFNGKEYRYQVKEKFVINPQEVDVVKNATSTDLILQTCWPPGTDWQRLIVYANLVEDSASSPIPLQSI